MRNEQVGLPVLGIDRHRMKTDGRGITTLVALAGCPLSCEYCLNKELLARNSYESLTPQELVERLAIDHCYFLYTNGGVTFGGGEPLLHSEQLAAFAKLCPPEWNITIETSLNVSPEQLQPFLTERFSFIIDCKAMQPEIYKSYTGRENTRVLNNLKAVIKGSSAENYVVKLPVIPGYSGDEEVMQSARLLMDMGIGEKNIVTFTYLM